MKTNLDNIQTVIIYDKAGMVKHRFTPSSLSIQTHNDKSKTLAIEVIYKVYDSINCNEAYFTMVFF